MTEGINVRNNFLNREVIDETISFLMITFSRHSMMFHSQEIFIYISTVES